MTVKIPRSSIPAGFDLDKAVADHVAELKAWGEHNTRCVAEAARREVTDPPPAEPLENQPYPPPVATHLVQAALDVTHNNDGSVSIVTDYAIDEDAPTAAQQAEQARQQLHDQVTGMERAAGEVVMPSAKRRYVEYQASDAEAVDAEKRTEPQQAAINARDAMRKGLDLVARHGAKLQAQIVDLKDDKIAGWTAEEFPR